VTAVTSVINIQAGEVRAETFGSTSLLYNLINKDASGIIEEVSSEQVVGLTPADYSDIFTVSTEDTEIDLLYEEQVSTTIGGSVLVAPTISEGSFGTAARSSVEHYTVQAGDILGSIAERYGLNLNTLLWANNLNYRSTIKPGQELTIPPTNGVLYTVKRGDTISSVAKKYNTTSDKILSFNNLTDSSALQIGSSLMLPDAIPPSSAPVRYTAPASSIFTGTRGTTPFTTAAGAWLWPTDGCYITVYFHQYYRWGLHQGLDIDGTYTSNIYATRGGTITRASWYDGYGNCIEIDHGDGYTTRYGHASKFYVSVGDTVNAGDVIGKVGTTGRSTGTHLHFEINSGGSHLNPLNFIRCR
jgi:murein DD-endopeptidase MepM/ murein hydrolase activator NlpD